MNNDQQERFKQASEAFQSGSPSQALSILVELSKELPNNPNVVFATAKVREKLGHSDHVRDLATRLVREFEDPRGKRLLANLEDAEVEKANEVKVDLGDVYVASDNDVLVERVSERTGGIGGMGGVGKYIAIGVVILILALPLLNKLTGGSAKERKNVFNETINYVNNKLPDPNPLERQPESASTPNMKSGKYTDSTATLRGVDEYIHRSRATGDVEKVGIGKYMVTGTIEKTMTGGYPFYYEFSVSVENVTSDAKKQFRQEARQQNLKPDLDHFKAYEFSNLRVESPNFSINNSHSERVIDGYVGFK